MIKYGNEQLLLIWLDSIASLSYNEKRAAFGIITESGGLKNGIKAAIINREKQLKELLGEKFTAFKTAMNNEHLKFTLDRMEDFGVKAVTFVCNGYPETLKQIENCPLVLYVKGNAELLKTECFAIVGSRKSIPLSVNLAKEYAVAAENCNFTLVTGIAEGVDAAVLETAVKNGASVISVMASGLDCVYPASHKNLAEEVCKTGLVVSEYPLGVSAQRYYFPIRNRIIAGLSRGVLIVSGGERSGVIHTGRYAMEFGKDLFAVPYSVGVASGVAPNRFIKTNAAFLTDDPLDLYDFYNVKKPDSNFELTNEEKSVLKALSGGKAHVEKIAAELNKNVWEITPVLSVLEIRGAVVKSGANEYSPARKILEE